MPVDPWGDYIQPIADSFYVGDDYNPPNWWDLASQGIDRATQAYIYGELGYPPGSTNIYAPQYPQYPQQQQQSPTPLPAPYPVPGIPPTVMPQTGGGIQLSTTTLMLLVGGVLLFMLGTKRGR